MSIIAKCQVGVYLEDKFRWEDKSMMKCMDILDKLV